MSTLAQARTALAGALDALSGYTVTAAPGDQAVAPKPGDGWVVCHRVYTGSEDGFRQLSADLSGVLVLGQDWQVAETAFDTVAAAAAGAVLDLAWPLADVSVEPTTLLVGQAQLPAALVNVTMEVDRP